MKSAYIYAVCAFQIFMFLGSAIINLVYSSYGWPMFFIALAFASSFSFSKRIDGWEKQ